MASKSAIVQPPFVLSVVLCDNIFFDAATGKRSLLGTFDELYLFTIPARIEQFCVFLELSGGRGSIPIRLLLTDADEADEPIYEGEIVARFRDPKHVAKLAFVLSEINFKSAGEYRLQIFAGGRFLDERRLAIQSTEAADEA